MDYKSVADFNKYTLAVGAAGAAFTVQKFAPTGDYGNPAFTLATLVCLIVSIISGILVFGTVTNGVYYSSKIKENSEKISEFSGVHAARINVDIKKYEEKLNKVNKRVGSYGRLHLVFLLIGYISISGAVLLQVATHDILVPTGCGVIKDQ